MTAFRRLSLATTLTTLGVIGVGALVRATGSGEGCPGWPRCFGRWIPPLERHAVIEYSHRFLGAIAIGMLVGAAILAVVRHRRERRIVAPTVAAAMLIFVQAGLGAVVVTTGLNPTLVTLHIGAAMILLGLLVSVTVTTFCVERLAAGKTREPVDRVTARLAIASAGSVFVLILAGAFVRGQGAGLAFPDWPLMNGRVIPAFAESGAAAHLVHRALALVVGLVLAAFCVRALRARPRDRAVSTFAAIALALFAVQTLVGAAQVWTGLAAPAVVAHVVLAGLIWASTVAAVAVTRHLAACAPGPVASGERNDERGFRETVLAYVELTKPRIVVLLLITTVPTMMLAARGLPSIWLVLATVFGGTLAAGAANAINCYFDRDIDEVMTRTRRRPLPAHRVTPNGAIAFALVLAATSFWFMALTVNLLSAALAQAAILFYVFVYTLGLKRTTPQNIVIGGAAGAVPALVGWAAVTGGVGIEAYVLFSIVFFWTPPHFWALATRYSKDYAAAGVPMLPVVAGARETARQILLYSIVMVAVTLALFPVAHMGAIYLAAALALGAWFLRAAMRLLRSGTATAALGLFRTSISYLALLFTAVGVDAFVQRSA